MKNILISMILIVIGLNLNIETLDINMMASLLGVALVTLLAGGFILSPKNNNGKNVKENDIISKKVNTESEEDEVVDIDEENSKRYEFVKTVSGPFKENKPMKVDDDLVMYKCKLWKINDIEKEIVTALSNKTDKTRDFLINRLSMLSRFTDTTYIMDKYPDIHNVLFNR